MPSRRWHYPGFLSTKRLAPHDPEVKECQSHLSPPFLMHPGLKSALHRAILRDELTFAYQPVVRLAEESISHFEVLLRWTDATFGKVAPSIFVPLAERSGLIVPLGRLALRGAVHQAASWSAALERPVPVSVNVSMQQLFEPDFSHEVMRLIRSVDIPANCLELEVTETQEARETALGHLLALRQEGVIVSLDDFGIGHSNFRNLSFLPISRLKIDRRFVADGVSGHKGFAIFQAMTTVAKSLALEIVAEGIETSAQRAIAYACGCDYGQGFFYGLPVDAAAAFAMLLKVSVGSSSSIES